MPLPTWRGREKKRLPTVKESESEPDANLGRPPLPTTKVLLAVDLAAPKFNS